MKTRKTFLLSLVALLLSLGSCKAYRDVENLSPKVSKEIKAGPFEKSTLSKLVSGERILVKSTTGFKYYMTYQFNSGNKLVGTVWKVDQAKLEIPKKIELPIEEIDQVWVRRFSAGATAPVIAAGGVALSFLLIIIALELSALGYKHEKKPPFRVAIV